MTQACSAVTSAPSAASTGLVSAADSAALLQTPQHSNQSAGSAPSQAAYQAPAFPGQARMHEYCPPASSLPS